MALRVEGGEGAAGDSGEERCGGLYDVDAAAAVRAALAAVAAAARLALHGGDEAAVEGSLGALDGLVAALELACRVQRGPGAVSL